MNLQNAKTIAGALNTIAEILAGHSEEMDDSIIVGVETYSEPSCAPNFYISKLEEFLEIGLDYVIKDSTFAEWPYEFVTVLDGIEIHCTADREALKRCGIAIPNWG